MGVTVNVNKISLCHKGSGGVVTATIPDVCKTPSPGGPVPIPYPNIAFASQLAKGSKEVKIDGGNSVAIKGSEFSTSVGDEPGTVGGVKSGVNMHKATWISYSFDVIIEGKNACRLTDKMLMNKGNTVSMGGYIQPPVSPDEIMYKLCEIACRCKHTINKQRCMAMNIKEEFYDQFGYPNEGSEVWQEVSMQEGANGWEVIMNRAGNAPTSNWFTPRGGIRPDLVLTDGAGNPTKIVEVKFPGDSLNKNQQFGGAYDQAAEDLGVDYEVMELDPENPDDNPCSFCWDGPPPPGVTAGDVGKVAAGIVAGVALAACIVAEPCGAGLLGAGALGGAALAN